ncbi:MAG: hypothetical protein K8S23_08480 [Candidatus Cloacimonetes bacterium]|nr:hypothetical protein [Candidatus Cloacimonadota bacterium]
MRRIIFIILVFIFTDFLSADPQQLTSGAGWKSNPSWSPDGSKILFTSNRNGNVDIWTIKTNGDSLTEITANITYDDQAEWSFDGSMIAYCSDDDIRIISASGGTAINLTSDSFINGAPFWSPNGSEIVFHSNRNGSFDIWKIPAIGGTAIQLTFLPGNEFEPSFSPNGSIIAFSSNHYGNYDIWYIPSEGGTPVPITSSQEDELEHNFSPDGLQIVYNYGQNPYRDIFTSLINGNNPQQITFYSGDDGTGTWSPNSSQIAFHSDRSGNYEIWILDIEQISIGDSNLQNSNKFQLYDNFPNPFNPTTTISFSLTTESTGLRLTMSEQAESTELVIYNLKGQKIKSFSINRLTNQPINQIVWNGTDQTNQPVSSGIYFYALQKDGKALASEKMLLLK